MIVMTNLNNRAELARLIHEHLTDKGVSSSSFVKMFEGVASERSVYKWMEGGSAPGGRVQRAHFEDVLGWKTGSVEAVLRSADGTRFELSELRDWEKLGDSEPAYVSRASELSNAELLMELTKRFGDMESKLEFLTSNSAPSQKAFGLAAHDTDEGRDSEFLEGR